MKKMKKLFPALCLLLVSATLLGTSTYAWFSMNKEVTANNISITAKSDAVYLLINESGAVNAGDTELDLNATNKELFPANLEGEDPSETNWYTAAGKSRADGTLENGTKKNLTTDNFANYVVKKTVYLTLAKGSLESGKLTVVGTTFEDNIGGASTVKFAVNGTVVGTMTAATKDTPIELKSAMTNTEAVKIDIYYYFNGDNTEITTANYEANTLTTSNVVFKFAVADKA